MAKVDYFLEIDGFEAESKDDAKTGTVDILSWSWGETNDGSFHDIGGGSTGTAHGQDVTVTTGASNATPKFVQACAGGKTYPSGRLICRKDDDGEHFDYLTIIFDKMRFSSYQTGGSQGDIIPIDTISINFAGITFKYAEQNDDGTPGKETELGWHFEGKKKLP